MGSEIANGKASGMFQFLEQLVDKGRATAGSIRPIASATKQILATVEGEEKWQDLDMSAVNIDDYIERFGVLTRGKYSAGSLRAYRLRFKKAVTWYSQFLVEPGWTPPKTTPTRPVTEAPAVKKPTVKLDDATKVVPVIAAVGPTSNKVEDSDLIAYPFPLRAGRVVRLHLPVDLKLSEAKRLGRYLESLSIDDEPEA